MKFKIDLQWLFKATSSSCDYAPFGETLIKYDYLKESGVLFIHIHSSGRDNIKGNVKSWVLNFAKMKLPVFGGVHSGFYSIAKSIEKECQKIITTCKPKKVVFVGYSQGGAVASILRRILPSCRAIAVTFAQPRAFGWGAKKDDNVIRIYVRGDKVTHLPFFLLCRYKHIGKKIPIGKRRIFSRIKWHYPEVYESNLKGRVIEI